MGALAEPSVGVGAMSAGNDQPGPRRIVSIGPLETAARHHHVLRAAQPAMAADPGLTLDLVGEGDEGEALLALAEDLGLAGRVRIVHPGC